MRRTLAIVMLALLATTVVACSGSGHNSDMSGMDDSEMHNSPVVAGAREIPVMANQLSFAPDSIRLRAGVPVAVVLTSKDAAHDFYVRGIGHVVHAERGRTARGGLTIKKPGTYEFWCTVSGHKAGGMVGTITVAV